MQKKKKMSTNVHGRIGIGLGMGIFSFRSSNATAAKNTRNVPLFTCLKGNQNFCIKRLMHGHTHRRSGRPEPGSFLLKARAGSGRAVRLTLLKYNDETDPLHIAWVVRLANENGEFHITLPA